jgi:hypothetical protein
MAIPPPTLPTPPGGGAPPTPPSPPSAGKRISGTYVQARACPSTVSVNVLNVNSTTFTPGSSYYGNAVLSVDTPPLRAASVRCSLTMTYTVGSTTNTVVLNTLSIPWSIGMSKMNMPFTFTMPDLGLAPNSTVSVEIAMDCTINCA